MLWYLLMPLRRSAQPPQLSANHPIRRAFYRHGKFTARNWLVAMLVSVAIAAAFSYPTFLLAGNPNGGFNAFPHKVWTTASEYNGDPANVDVEMYQIWIHGSYMRALDKDALKAALHIQQAVVGDDGSPPNLPSGPDDLSSGKLSWGYHSPLIYWNNSASSIDADGDVLQTIHDSVRKVSPSLNLALRPASVFAGKKFKRKRLSTADALVITLMSSSEAGMGIEWRNKMESLLSDTCVGCSLYPSDGRIADSSMVQVLFTPQSLKENLLLTVAYSLVVLYVLLSLRRIKAFHSRFGLVVTVITQMKCSILSSITICSLLKINLSTIPQNVYPFVVLVIGLENMFRVINAVLAYPPTMETELRIANALGDVGPISLATAVQNLVILSALYTVVSPGVAAFCVFAGIATLFDAFFLFTFFIAVLNVDIRRFELQDALARSNNTKHKRRPSPTDSNHSWFDALVQGRLPFSTSIAGTAVTTTFILSLNYHFFEHEDKFTLTGITQSLGLVRRGMSTSLELNGFVPPPINASQTPSQWMRMQEFDTAKEVLNLVNPGAEAFIVRVFKPLIVVLPNADRTGFNGHQTWTLALWSFTMQNFYPVAVAVVFAVAFVAVLMNYLLYSEVNTESTVEREVEEEIAVRSITLPHKLDIVKLSGSDKGHFISVGLDRSIAIARFDRTQQCHNILNPPPEVPSAIHWPVYDAVIDETAEWAALRCAKDQIVAFGTDNSKSTVVYRIRYPDDNPAIKFGFSRQSSGESVESLLLVLTSGGWLVNVCMETGQSLTTRLMNVPLLGATVIDSANQPRRLIVVTDQADAFTFHWNGREWLQASARLLPIRTDQGRLRGAVQISHCADGEFEFITIASSRGVVFMDMHLLNVIGVLHFDKDEPSFNRVILGPVTKCLTCCQPAVRCIALVNDVSSDGECSMTTIWPWGNSSAAICLKAHTSVCYSFEKAERTKHTMANAGAWSAVTSQAILGLRRPMAQQQQPEPARGRGKLKSSSSSLSLQKRRRAKSVAQPTTGNSGDDMWEAYKFSLDGDIETSDVPADVEDDEALFVNSAGPAVPLDSQSIAVAFGNSIKIIRATRRGSVSSRKCR